MTNQTYNDPFEAAANAELPQMSGTYFGKVEITADFVVLEKGIGKRPFEPQSDKEQDKRTNMGLAIYLLPEMGLRFDIDRQVLAESKTWIEITWASLKELGLTSPRDIYGRYVAATLEPTGRKFKSKNDNEEKNETAIKFLALYANEDECRKAFLEQKNGGSSTPPAPTEQSKPSAPVNNQQAVALQFARTVVKKAMEGKTKPDEIISAVGMALANNATLKDFFTAESPQIQQMIMENMGNGNSAKKQTTEDQIPF